MANKVVSTPSVALYMSNYDNDSRNNMNDMSIRHEQTNVVYIGMIDQYYDMTYEVPLLCKYWLFMALHINRAGIIVYR